MLPPIKGSCHAGKERADRQISGGGMVGSWLGSDRYPVVDWICQENYLAMEKSKPYSFETRGLQTQDALPSVSTIQGGFHMAVPHGQLTRHGPCEKVSRDRALPLVALVLESRWKKRRKSKTTPCGAVDKSYSTNQHPFPRRP